jgi:hypothetical protein
MLALVVLTFFMLALLVVLTFPMLALLAHSSDQPEILHAAKITSRVTLVILTRANKQGVAGNSQRVCVLGVRQVLPRYTPV